MTLTKIFVASIFSAWLCAAVAHEDAARVELDVDPALSTSETDWRAWINGARDAVASVGDGFPVAQVRVVLHLGSGRDPVSHGWVRRITPPEIHVKVNKNADLEALVDDWHLYHEFAHLLLPFAGNRDIWFSEGMASYYQYFLQARAGVIDADEAWRRLVAGFQRGFDDPAGEGERLVILSPEMWRKRAFRRVYWSGAAFFLRVDYRLRQATGGEQSLDTTLASFAACCMRDDSERWSARALVKRLGELSLPEIWTDEYAHVMQSQALPDFGIAASALGLSANDQQVRLSADPEARARRNALALGLPLQDEETSRDLQSSP